MNVSLFLKQKMFTCMLFLSEKSSMVWNDENVTFNEKLQTSINIVRNYCLCGYVSKSVSEQFKREWNKTILINVIFLIKLGLPFIKPNRVYVTFGLQFSPWLLHSLKPQVWVPIILIPHSKRQCAPLSFYTSLDINRDISKN